MTDGAVGAWWLLRCALCSLFRKPNGNDLGVDLKKGDSVTLNGPCPINNADNTNGENGWCVVTDTTINRSGAVWGDSISK